MREIIDCFGHKLQIPSVEEIRADAIDECIKTLTDYCCGMPNSNLIGALEQLKE